MPDAQVRAPSAAPLELEFEDSDAPLELELEPSPVEAASPAGGGPAEEFSVAPVFQLLGDALSANAGLQGGDLHGLMVSSGSDDVRLSSDALAGYSPPPNPIDDEIVPSQDVPVPAKTELELELGPGAIIGGRYRVLGRIGEGGMGVVYRVEHTLMQKELALKLLRPEVSTIPQVAKRFEREARASCQLDHPNIVRVTDFGREPNGMLFLVMELLVGESLLDRLARGAAMPIDEGLEIVDQLLSALDHAHGREIVHRDLKPDNVMLSRRDGATVVKILDFGIAKVASIPIEPDHPPLTQRGMVFGTPQYMSPEQASGETVDGRADLYTVGVILYQMLTRRLPFDGEDMSSILMRQITQPPPPLDLDIGDRQLALSLEQLMTKALAKDRAERFGTPAEFRAAIEAVREGHWPPYPPRPERLSQRQIPTEVVRVRRGSNGDPDR
jgi:serine/threonine protein kinase